MVDFTAAGYSVLRGPREWQDEVIAIANETQTCIWHAHHLWRMEHPPETRCSICGERNAERHRYTDWVLTSDHALCEARQRRGLPIEPLTWKDDCSCWPCAEARGEH